MDVNLHLSRKLIGLLINKLRIKRLKIKIRLIFMNFCLIRKKVRKNVGNCLGLLEIELRLFNLSLLFHQPSSHMVIDWIRKQKN